ARIKIDREQSTNLVAVYDPYFKQTEFEVIQSEPVLKKVIKDLNLDETWAKQKGSGQKLTTEETLRLLRKNLDLRVVSNRDVVEIRAKGEKPEEAANIANAVAEAYQNYRRAAGELSVGGVKALQQQLAAQEQKIALAERELKDLEGKTNA